VVVEAAHLGAGKRGTEGGCECVGRDGETASEEGKEAKRRTLEDETGVSLMTKKTLQGALRQRSRATSHLRRLQK